MQRTNEPELHMLNPAKTQKITQVAQRFKATHTHMIEPLLTLKSSHSLSQRVKPVAAIKQTEAKRTGMRRGEDAVIVSDS